jgi:hypothetical protein
MQQCQVRVWCLHSGGLNPGPLGHESSALTTRPRLLAYYFRNTYYLTDFMAKQMHLKAVS